jgi:hypothetical protein
MPAPNPNNYLPQALKPTTQEIFEKDKQALVNE